MSMSPVNSPLISKCKSLRPKIVKLATNIVEIICNKEFDLNLPSSTISSEFSRTVYLIRFYRGVSIIGILRRGLTKFSEADTVLTFFLLPTFTGNNDRFPPVWTLVCYKDFFNSVIYFYIYTQNTVIYEATL